MEIMIFVDDVRRRDLEQHLEGHIYDFVRGPKPEDLCACGEMRQYYGHLKENEGKEAGFNRHGTLFGHPFVGAQS